MDGWIVTVAEEYGDEEQFSHLTRASAVAPTEAMKLTMINYGAMTATLNCPIEEGSCKGSALSAAR